MSRSQGSPERRQGRERRADETVVATTSAERYVMSAGRTSRLAVKEGDLFLYSDDLGQVPGAENSALGLGAVRRHTERFLIAVCRGCFLAGHLNNH